jgi:lysophospholipid acyltransferase (LPLAT)-like uncharacterized protein
VSKITLVEPSIQAGDQSEYSARTFSWRERLALWLITWAGYLLVRLIGPTLRFVSTSEPDSTCDGTVVGQAIYCFWHRSVVPATYRFSGRQLAVMTSRSFDGEYIARIIQKFGFRAVRGSSSRGAVGALIGMRKELEQGHSAVFTIDGPRGPVYVAKPGPVLLAKKTGHKITCFYIAVQRAWVLNSWDRMMIPKPFSRAAVYLSSPISVPADASEEQMAALHQLMQATLERCRLKAEEALSAQRLA